MGYIKYDGDIVARRGVLSQETVMSQIIEARFKASMLGLQQGDVIVRNRDGESLFSVVIERCEEKGALLFKISSFSPIVSIHEYQKCVRMNERGWLVDTSGAIMVLPEEWGGTEKDCAKSLLEQIQKKKQGSAKDKAKEIFESIRDVRKSLVRNAEDILKNIGYDSPSKEQIFLLAFALECAADRVWEL